MKSTLALTIMATVLSSWALPAPGSAADRPDFEAAVPPEIITAVALSNSDINRIVCPGTMNDLIFSKEKGLDGHFSGNNAFVKFKISKKGDELIYAGTPSELFVVCNNVVYSLIATPKAIPAVTLRLAPAPGDTVKQNVALYQDLPLEKKALQLIKTAATGNYPSSYRVMTTDLPVRLSADLDTRLKRVVDVEGVGLRLKEIKITSLATEPIDLNEKYFLKPDVGEAILAVSVEKHRLAPKESTRALVVEQREREL